MKYALFFNSLAFGDTIFGINAARRFKEHNPDYLIGFVVRGNFNLTTNDGASGMQEALEVYSKQPWIDGVGYLALDEAGRTSIIISNPDLQNRQPDIVFQQTRWWSDVGAVRSANYSCVEYLPEEVLQDGNLHLHVEIDDPQDDILRIAMSGPLDWNRKLQSERTRMEVVFGMDEILSSRNIQSELNMFGVEMADYTMYQSLCVLKTHDLFIGPIGSFTHGAAALGLDTITIPSVFMPESDCPEFYTTKGNHYTVRHLPENHCGYDVLKCVTPKLYENRDSEPAGGMEGPNAEFGFWPRRCPHTESGWSCTKQVQAKNVLDTFERWLDGKYK